MSGLDDTPEQKRYDDAVRTVFRTFHGTKDEKEFASLIRAVDVLGESLFGRVMTYGSLYRGSVDQLQKVRSLHCASGPYCAACDDENVDVPFSGEKYVGNNPECIHYWRCCYVCEKEKFPCETRQLVDAVLGK